MVGLFKALLPPLLLATFAAAQAQNAFNITNPTPDIWWVAKSTNVLAWDCQSSAAVAINNFTVLINNISPSVFVGPLAFIAIQNNDDCSVTVTQDQVSQPAGTGYILSFANPLNNTDVYTMSQFEIKPLGSLYPSQVSSSASAASGTAVASSSASASSKSNGVAHNSHSPTFLGLAGIMGLLAAGLLVA
jgi:hypothetical protein